MFVNVFSGPALAGVSGQSNNPAVVGQGVFATASFATFKMRKDVELWEICHTMLQKVPKAYNKVWFMFSIWLLVESLKRARFNKWGHHCFHFLHYLLPLPVKVHCSQEQYCFVDKKHSIFLLFCIESFPQHCPTLIQINKILL